MAFVHAPDLVAREVFGSRQGRRRQRLVVGRPRGLGRRRPDPPRRPLVHQARLRSRLVDDARKRVRRSWRKRGAAPAELGWKTRARPPTDHRVRAAFPVYKPPLLLPERLKRLLLHPERPIQLVIAGKAHPADEDGKEIIQDMVRFSDDPGVPPLRVPAQLRHRHGAPLYPGCDVWLNNPLRPLEAAARPA